MDIDNMPRRYTKRLTNNLYMKSPKGSGFISTIDRWKCESGQNDSFSSTFFQLMNSDPDLKMELLSNPFEAFLREMLPSFFEQAQDSSHQ